MTTLTLTHPSIAAATTIVETLRARGFAEADVALFTAEDPDTGPDEAALTQRLTAFAIDPAAAADKAHAIAAGAAIVAVRVTDETRDLALAILEGRGDDPVNDHRAGDETTAAALNDLDAQTVRATSG